MSKVVNPENVGTVGMRYAFAPRLREYLRDAPPGCGHRVCVVETGGICPSGHLHYKRIGDVLTDARYSGDFPIEWLEDRGRDVHAGSFTRFDTRVDPAMTDAAGWLRNLPSFLLRRARWAAQPVHVSVWVEKQALEGVFEPVCDELGVIWFACKGYPSVSALWEWLKSVKEATSPAENRKRFHFPGTDINWTEHHRGHAKECVVLYFGDHDPDGWEIPRSARRNLDKLMEVKGIDIPVRFKRIALNRDQIDEYSPPPFEAKVTSARYAGYVEEHDTEEAWELDALEPTVLRDLIRGEVNALFDDGVSAEQEEEIASLRAEMIEAMRDSEWASSVLGSADEDEDE